MTSPGAVSYLWSGSTEWEKVFALVAQNRLPVAIINPASGPGTVTDPGVEAIVQRLDKSNVRVVGYCDTNYGHRETEPTLADARMYRDLYYPYVKGLFFDQTMLRDSLANVMHTDALMDLVRPYHGTSVFNPGVEMVRPERMKEGSLWMTRETDAVTYLNETTRVSNPSREWHCIHTCPSLDAAREVADKMSRLGIRIGTITRDGGENPYDTFDLECMQLIR